MLPGRTELNSHQLKLAGLNYGLKARVGRKSNAPSAVCSPRRMRLVRVLRFMGEWRKKLQSVYADGNARQHAGATYT